MLDLTGTFDSTNALTGMYLWLIFGYLSRMLNCDLQRFMSSSVLVTHLMGVTAFFFLFTVIDDNNSSKATVGKIWIKTVFIYVLFMLMIKSKWYFVVPVLGLLLVDQTLKQRAKLGSSSPEEYENRVGRTSRALNNFIILIIVVGNLHYMYLQWLEYKKDFSFVKFFAGTTNKCKTVAPKYKTGLDMSLFR